MESDSFFEGLALGLILSLFIAISAVKIAQNVTEYRIHQEAVEAGAGEYVITDKNSGHTEFKWINNKNKKD